MKEIYLEILQYDHKENPHQYREFCSVIEGAGGCPVTIKTCEDCPLGSRENYEQLLKELEE